LRLPGRQASVLPALVLDLSSVAIFGKSPAIGEEPALHASGHRHTSLKQWASLAEVYLAAPCKAFATSVE